MIWNLKKSDCEENSSTSFVFNHNGSVKPKHRFTVDLTKLAIIKWNLWEFFSFWISSENHPRMISKLQKLDYFYEILTFDLIHLEEIDIELWKSTSIKFSLVLVCCLDLDKIPRNPKNRFENMGKFLGYGCPPSWTTP